MNEDTTFLGVFRGDKIKIHVEKEDGKIIPEKGKIVSVRTQEPRIINGVPMAGYKSAIIEQETENGAEVKWLHMKREVAEDKELQYGKYELETEETFDGVPTVQEREKIRTGTVNSIEIIN